MPKLKHFAIATLVVGGLCALVGGLIWLGSLYPKVFGALVLLAFAAALIFVFASTYTANEEIMKGNDDG